MKFHPWEELQAVTDQSTAGAPDPEIHQTILTPRLAGFSSGLGEREGVYPHPFDSFPTRRKPRRKQKVN